METLQQSHSKSERAPKSSKSGAALPDTDIQIIQITDPRALVEWIPAWHQLVTVAVESNVFYEPELLIPALQHYGNNNVRLLIATASERGRPNSPRLLCGLMPLVRSEDERATRIPSLEMWRYSQAFLTTPLLRADVGVETLTAFWNYLGEQKAAPMWVTMPCVRADGPFQHLLVQFLQQTQLDFCVRSMHRRALFRPSSDVDAFFARWSKVRRHSVNRLECRLSERGKLTVHHCDSIDDLPTWIEQFLEMESMGWKGRTGTALAHSDADRNFTDALMRNSLVNNKLMLLGLKLDDKPIAFKCNLLTGDGGFAWKIAYDESHAKYSPGCVLEKACIAKLHEMPHLQWMDSCARPDHPMIDSLWPDRAILQSIAITTSRRGSRLAISSLPMLRWLRNYWQDTSNRFRRSKPSRPTSPPEES